MSDIYIAYQREDRGRVQPLAAALLTAGFTVWWDRDLEAGEGWRARMEHELGEARCVIVAWSKTSVGADAEFVHDEAQRASERGVLLPVMLDKIKPPLGFGGRQTIDLTGWSGDLSDPRFLSIRAAAEVLVAGGASREAVARSTRLRTMAFAATVFAVFSSALGFAVNLASVQEPACRVSVVRACLCRPFGLGGVPTKAEEDTYAAAKARTGGDGLRTYLRRYPSGVFAAEAQTRLAGCRIALHERWTPDVRTQPLIISAAAGRGSEATARADALARGKQEAAFVCAGYAQGEFRLTASEANAQAWTCAQHAGGVSCGFDGQAVCKVDVRHSDSQEICRD